MYCAGGSVSNRDTGGRGSSRDMTRKRLDVDASKEMLERCRRQEVRAQMETPEGMKATEEDSNVQEREKRNRK
ncbi:hypothetical protein RJT34_12770 [Clitoria ternatea]|uniref:Uncharacterized protein n=1 Tax=Clitoria ternatea TaxID=43366 RepID=A0AAN9PL31_CLITE